MTYILSMQEQLVLFCKSLGFGFLVGIGYDLFALFRLLLSKGKGLAAWEIGYALLAAVCSFLFDLTLNGGDLRLYMLAAECLGFALWYFAAGVPFRCGVRSAIRFCGRTAQKISVPLRRISQRVQNVEESGKIKIKKVLKKTNVLLKLRAKLVYNLRQ